MPGWELAAGCGLFIIPGAHSKDFEEGGEEFCVHRVMVEVRRWIARVRTVPVSCSEAMSGPGSCDDTVRLGSDCWGVGRFPLGEVWCPPSVGT